MVLGDPLRHEVGAHPRHLGQPARHCDVEAGALGTRERGVARVAQEGVAVCERVAGDRVAHRAGEERATTERLEALQALVELERGEGSDRQATPRHRSAASDEAGVGRQVVELGGVDRLHGERQRHRVRLDGKPPRVAVVHERADARPRPQQLLDEERRPVGALRDGRDELLGERRAEQGVHERAGIGRREGCEVEPLPGGAPRGGGLEQARPCRGNHETAVRRRRAARARRGRRGGRRRPSGRPR